MTAPLAPINDKQAVFVKLVVSGLSLRAAARQAGYAEAGATTLAYQPHIQAAIMARMQHQLRTVHAPAAMALLGRIMRNDNELAANRIKCAQLLMDRAGLVPPKAAEPEAPNQKDAAEMTTREIEEFIAKAQGEIASRQAKTIDITPQADDIFD